MKMKFYLGMFAALNFLGTLRSMAQGDDPDPPPPVDDEPSVSIDSMIILLLIVAVVYAWYVVNKDIGKQEGIDY